jgi:hypothetical protein
MGRGKEEKSRLQLKWGWKFTASLRGGLSSYAILLIYKILLLARSFKRLRLALTTP